MARRTDRRERRRERKVAEQQKQRKAPFFKRPEVLLFGGIAIIGLAIGVVVFAALTANNTTISTSGDLESGDAQTLGPADAPVSIVVFSDYQ